ncbi:MAG TPA: hypothetical protein VIQ99_03905 [Gammaproteobacteria bacterium]
MRHAVDRARTALTLLFAALAAPLAAQDAEVPRAPRIIGAPAATAPSPAASPPPPGISIVMRPPTAARLAPLPEDRDDGPEEIIVVGRGWRLPDLGSEWRARQEEQARSDRLNATLLPLYNPDKPPPHETTFLSPEQRRHGYIELFRVRFGRPRD